LASSCTRVFPAISATPFDRLRSPLPLAQEPTKSRHHLWCRHRRGSECLGPTAPPHALGQTRLCPADIGPATPAPPRGIGLDVAVGCPDDPEQIRLGPGPSAAETGSDRWMPPHRSSPSADAAGSAEAASAAA